METLEDVLAGPETEVMDGIQVTKKDDHPISFPRNFYDFSLQAGIDRYNLRATSSAQRVQKWTLLPTDFSIPGERKKNFKHAFALLIVTLAYIQGGEMGPTLKVKRHLVMQKYKENVDKLYAV